MAAAAEGSASSAKGLVSAETLCGITGLTDRRHRQLASDGFFPSPVRGEYQFVPALKGLFRYFREQLHGSTGKSNINDEKLRKLREEADKLALENEKTRGNLVETEAVYKHFEGIFVSFRQRVLASGLSDDEKDELLNDLRRLKAKGITATATGATTEYTDHTEGKA